MTFRRASALGAVALVIGSAIGFGEMTARGEGELPGQTFLVSSLSDGAPMEFPFATSAPSTSGDGRFLVWTALSPCPGIVRRAQPSCGYSVQLKDRLSGGQAEVARLATSGDANTEPVISRDGCTIVFTTNRAFSAPDTGTNADVYAQDRCNPQPTPQLLSRPVGQWFNNPSVGRRPAVSGNGRFVAFSYEPDPGGTADHLALVDRDPDLNGNPFDTPPAIEIVADPGGGGTTQGAIEPALSDDGSRLAFSSSTNPPGTPTCVPPYCPSQIYLLDRNAGSFNVVSQRAGTIGNAPSRDPSISGDGRIVAFVSQAQNLSDVALPACPSFPSCTRRLHARDLAAEPELIALNEGGAPGTNGDAHPALSFDGNLVAFAHFGDDLVAPPAPADFEGADIILVNRVTRRPTRISVNPGGAPTTLDNNGTSINNNGRFVGFLAGEAQEILGVALNEESQILVRDRAAALSVTPLDFGAVTVGGLAEVRTATVTNTTGASFEIAAISSNNGEFAVGGGTCGPGTKLAPGQSCSVDVAYAPAGDGAGSGTLTIESVPGFDANPSGAGSLNGSGQPPPTTPTIDTIPPTDPPTTPPPPPTTTPAPAVNSLTISPQQAAFAATPLAVVSVAQAFTVRNTGNQSNTVTAAALIGANPGDYLVTSDACAAVSLAPNATCSIGVAFRPTATGARPATVRVDGTGGSSASATLAGDGASAPTLVFSPAVAKGSSVTIAIGGGFPASTSLALALDGQSGALTVTTDAIGAFRLPVVVRGGQRPGTLTLTVTGVPSQFDSVSAPLLVVLGTYQPQNGTGPAFGNSSILSRG